MNKSTETLLRAALAGLIGAAAFAAPALADHHEGKKKEAKPAKAAKPAKKDKKTAKGGAAASVECWGVNACKGSGECGGKGHGCAGHNACKGKGWVKKSAEDCTKAGGSTTAPKS